MPEHQWEHRAEKKVAVVPCTENQTEESSLLSESEVRRTRTAKTEHIISYLECGDILLPYGGSAESPSLSLLLFISILTKTTCKEMWSFFFFFFLAKDQNKEPEEPEKKIYFFFSVFPEKQIFLVSQKIESPAEKFEQ